MWLHSIYLMGYWHILQCLNTVQTKKGFVIWPCVCIKSGIIKHRMTHTHLGVRHVTCCIWTSDKLCWWNSGIGYWPNGCVRELAVDNSLAWWLELSGESGRHPSAFDSLELKASSLKAVNWHSWLLTPICYCHVVHGSLNVLWIFCGKC